MKKNLLTMSKLWTVNKRMLLALLGIFLFSTIGCGGGAITQEDMMRRSRRRTAKEKEEEKSDATQLAANIKQPAEPQQTKPDEIETTKVAASSKPVKSSKPQVVQASPTDFTNITTDTRKKPTKPLSFPERGRLSAANLDRIAQALEAYLQGKGKYPPQAVYDAAKAPLLSWRVELLPYLGYQELYDAFDLTKPWNSPVNKPLLEKIPAVYQSPERYNTKTNYLLATGSSTVFPNARTASLRRVEDGIEHCALVVEVNDALATPWTKPKEYQVNLQRPKNGLGQIRQEQVFVIWGGGITGAVPTSLVDKNFKAMFTIDGGESFSSYAVSVPLDEDYFAQQPEVSPSPIAKASQSNGSHTRASNSKFANRRSRQSSAALSSGLAGEFFDAAATSYSMNQPSNALLWYYASNLLQLDNTSWTDDYRWVPALKRPCATIHFCVGVQSKTNERRARRKTRKQGGVDAQRGIVISHISDTGEQLLSIIEKHAESLTPAALGSASTVPAKGSDTRTNNRRKNRAAIPVSYLGTGSRSELTQKAVAQAADVLVLFEVRSVAEGARKWLDLELVDLANGKKFLSVSRIQITSSAYDSQALDSDETLKKSRWQLEDTLEDTLSLQDWPEGLKARHAAARVTALADSKTLNPLAALAEMCVYRNRNLIDTQQLLRAYRALLGEDAGEALMLGSDKKRKRVLRQWLPDIQPSELQQLAQLQRKSIDDDD